MLIAPSSADCWSGGGALDVSFAIDAFIGTTSASAGRGEKHITADYYDYPDVRARFAEFLGGMQAEETTARFISI